MQILVISSKFPFPLKDGGAVATYALISGLSKLNNQLFVLSFNTQKHFIEPKDIPATAFDKIAYSLVDADTSPRILSAISNLAFSKLPYILERFKSQKFEQELIRILGSNNFDIVQIEGLYMLQYIPIIRQYSNAKIAYRPHNVEFQIWDKLSLSSSGILKKLYFKILSDRILKYELSLLNTYDLILPISNEDANIFNHSGNRLPCLVVPTGFEIQNIEITPIELNNPSLFFIGSLEWLPNQEGIIWFLNNCWDVLHNKFPNLKWYIAGRNAPINFEKKFDKPGIEWKGEIDNASEFIKDKSIMIVPLLSGSGMRIKIIEAFAHAKPVVSTSLGARGTMAQDDESILLADSPEKFIEQIIRLFEQAQLFKKLAINGHEHAKSMFDNNFISKTLMTFYSQHLTHNK